MKRFLLQLSAVAIFVAPLNLSATPFPHSTTKKISKDCTFKGKKLYGKIKVVSSFPDFKIKKVTSFPDLKVKKVSSFPDKCGKWKFVGHFPDIKIKWVDSFEDFSIKFVDSFPGVP